MSKNLQVLLICLLIAGTALRAEFPLNTIRFYDVRYWAYEHECKAFDFGTYAMDWYDIKGMNCAKQHVGALQLWNCTENALAMVRGFDPATQQGQIAAQLSNVPDDGIFGRYAVNGNLRVREFGFGLQWHLPHDFLIGIYVPFVDASMQNITWQRLQDASYTSAQILFDQLIGNDFFTRVNQLGNGLSINQSWTKTGLGDIKSLIWWRRNFVQQKQILTDVLLGLRVGVSLPTGLRENPNLLLSMPFGNDGATGVLFGGLIQFYWKRYFTGAIDADFMKLFGTSKVRRVQVDPLQTDHLFLAELLVRKDWGFVQRFNLWAGIHHLIDGASFDVGYQFLKQWETELSVFDTGGQRFSLDIMNSAASLQEWMLHQLWVSAKYTFNHNTQAFWLMPTIQLYWTNTFKATRGILNKSIGGTISFSF
ncbi:hypothetical protein M1466_00280 [Candidatus Dependentiae bacterium]|nr:hypothetical protein [Candidatus Dependentiae bacterium]